MASAPAVPHIDDLHPALRKSAVPYSVDVAEEILLRIASGEPLTAICRSDPKRFPTPMGFAGWMSADPGLAVAHAYVRRLQADAIADDALRIVDAEPERVVTYDADGKSTGARIDAGSVQWAKMRAEMRLKLIAKWDPERYGDTIKHTGKIDGTLEVNARLDIDNIVSRLRDASRQRLAERAEASQAVIEHDDGSDLV